mmetsp:Transcript_30309/g.86515  ORF Transcript_30309/g.86515 Transcript_30309/m.86515 type:complete len:248 (-) Transcript_30309:778-1521(-)
MDLHDEPEAEAPQLLVAPELQHGPRDHVGGRTLDAEVDRRALGLVAQPRLDVFALREQWHGPPTSQQRYHALVLVALPLALLDPPLDAGLALEPSADQLGGLVPGDAQVLCQGRRRLPVDDPEVDRLRLRPLHREHVLDRRQLASVGLDARRVLAVEHRPARLHRLVDVGEHLRRDLRVVVPASPQRLDHPGALRHVRQHAELELGVVGDDVCLPRRGDKQIPDLVLVLCELREILQIRRAACQAPG